MTLSGDPAGLEALKQIREQRKDFLKFLITEAKSSMTRSATFKDAGGRQWKLLFHPDRDEMEVQPGP
ncbi:MAG: hypothetical protein HY906_06305 [Deltaproteobacteria bacterium]|nr:hypothetical protein [Deltaproteobacteria bacterium]